MKKDRINALPAFGKTGRMGTYTLILTVVVLAVLVVVNLIVGALPSRITALDTSVSKMYTLSETSTDFVSGIDENVTLYFICANGSEDPKTLTFLERFADLSPKIRVKTVDPIEDTSFLEKYNAESVSNFSVVVAGEKRSKAVDYNDMYYYYNENTGKMSAEEYNQACQYMMMYGASFESYYGPATEYFDGDNAMTGAIEYVTAEKVPTVYLLEGHNEQNLSQVVSLNLFEYSDIHHGTVNIALDDIPEDADVILINTPASDFAPEETAKLTAFLDNGGNVILITAAGCEMYENLGKFTGTYGMKALAGTVSEGDSSMYYSRAPQYIYANIDSAHEATADYAEYAASNGLHALIPYAHAIETSGAAGVTVTPLFTTSEKARLGDSGESAAYTLAAAAEKGEGKLLWIGSSQMLSDTFVNGTNGANFYLFYFMFHWMQGNYQSGLPEISGVEMSEATLSVTTAGVNLWGTVLIFIVPLTVIGGGLAYWIYRRRK